MITLKELSFSYSRKKEVLDRINLEVGSGHICGLLGKLACCRELFSHR